MFSLPENNSLTVYLQRNTNLYTTEDFSGKSFIFAPFNYQDQAFCIPEEKAEVFDIRFDKEIIDQEEISLDEMASEKKNYCKLIKKVINTINSKGASKIVFSRCKKVLIEKFKLDQLINHIFNLYPNAFRYVWYHPEIGLWCGATPEVLVKTRSSSFETMALAGTKEYVENKPPNWDFKEIEEQQIVVDAITSSLEKVTSILKVSKTYNYRAASLVHLRTDISGILKKGKTTLSSITSALHPTPAVCGTPQEFAKEYIIDNEGYNRLFYTGFLGHICGKENCSNLFVNLRCMKIEDNIAYLYVGGGITKDSQPESEWEETRQKLQTMLQVLQPML